MSADDANQQSPANEPARSPSTHGSGKGSNTALEALIRQRRLGQAPADHLGPPDETPAQG